MRARIERSDLLDALDLVAPAVSTRGLPVFACVRVDVTGKTARFTATDIELTVAAEATIADGVKGTAIVPHGLFSKAVANMSPGAVTVELADDGTFTVTGTPGKVRMRSMDVDQWPKPPAEAEGVEAKFTADEVALIVKALPYASTDHDRAGLCCVRFDGADGVLVTDSYRAIFVDLPTALDCGIPADGLRPALKAAGDGPLLVTVGPSHATLATDRAAWTVRLVDSSKTLTVAKAQQLIPDSPPQSVTVDRHRLLDALDLVSVAAGSESLVKLEAADTGILDVSARAVDVGDADATIEATGTIGAHFNVSYLRSILNTVNGDDVTIRSVDHLKPAVVAEGPVRLLIMPVRSA